MRCQGLSILKCPINDIALPVLLLVSQILVNATLCPSFQDPFFSGNSSDQDQEQIVSKREKSLSLPSPPSSSFELKSDANYFVVGVCGIKHVGKTLLINTFIELSGGNGAIAYVEQKYQDPLTESWQAFTMPIPAVKMLGMATLAFAEVHWLDKYQDVRFNNLAYSLPHGQHRYHNHSEYNRFKRKNRRIMRLIASDAQKMNALIMVTDDDIESWSYVHYVEKCVWNIPVYHIQTKQDFSSQQKSKTTSSSKAMIAETISIKETKQTAPIYHFIEFNLDEYKQEIGKSLMRVSSITGKNILKTLKMVTIDFFKIVGIASPIKQQDGKKVLKDKYDKNTEEIDDENETTMTTLSRLKENVSLSKTREKSFSGFSLKRKKQNYRKRESSKAGNLIVRRGRKHADSGVFEDYLNDPLLLEKELNDVFFLDTNESNGHEWTTRKLRNDEEPTRTCFCFCLIL